MSGVALDPAVHLILRLALSVLLMWAAGHKLSDRDGFGLALARYELVPARAVAATALGLSVLEMVVAVAVWLPAATPVAGFTAAGLFALYASAVAINLARGRTAIACGCAGVAGDQLLSGGLVCRNLVLVVAALALTVPWSPRMLTWLDAITVAAAVSVLAMVYSAVDGLLANAPRLTPLTDERLADEVEHA